MTNIALGITGSIAAYKSPELLKLLVDSGYIVKVLMTNSAEQFVTPLTCAVLSDHKVYRDVFDEDEIMAHISLARWADMILIAPASANFIAKLALGLADDMLTNICLATKSPICVVPAMNQAMWSNGIVQSNVSKLIAHGIQILGPIEGTQICGENGIGKMISLSEILAHIEAQR